MTIPRLFNSELAIHLVLAMLMSLLLTACSTEENYTGGGVAGVGGGVVQGASQTVTLAWVAPVEREDGTPISMTEISGYRVYYGMSEGDYTHEVDVKDSDTMQVTLDSLIPGTYYIVVTTYDTEGRESAYSSPVVRVV